MLKVNEVLCVRHKGIIAADSCVYYDGQQNVFFKLKKKGFGYVLDDIDFGDLPLETELVLDKVKEINGVPAEIEVWYKTGELQTKRIFSPANRVCPYCLKKHNPEIVHLMDDAGFYPSFTLAEIGISETGKSTWKTAVTTVQIEKAISKLAGKNYKIEIVKAHMAKKKDAHAPNAIVDLKYNVMRFKKNKKVLANLYLIDTAGEFCVETLSSTNEFTELVSFLNDYADGVFAFYDPRFVTNECMNKYKSKRKEISGDFRVVFSQLHEPTVPVAIVMTGADCILTAMKEQAEGVMMNEKSPIITVNSPLFHNVGFSKEEISKYIMLVYDFFDNATQLVGGRKENEAYFLVSSGSMSEKQFDYTHSYNVGLPLVWMMNQLGILEIK